MEGYQARRTSAKRWAPFYTPKHGRRLFRASRSWLYAAELCVSAAVIALVWTSAAPALTVPALGAQAQLTFDAGGNHNVAIGTDGKLRVWGENESGGLGDGTAEDRWKPTALASVTEWRAVSAGERHTLAIAADGSLWAWGWNYWGQVGDGSMADKRSPLQIDSGDWIAVSAGYGHSLAIRADGSLWSWGYNYNGQLGIGSIGDRYSPGRVGTDTDWVAVAAGDYHSLALKSDGTLWGWGLNDYGEVGDGDLIDRYVPVRVGTDNHWVAIAAGQYHSLGLRSGGTLWAWGINRAGQLGDGAGIDRSSPVMVGSGWTAVAAGGSHTLALKADGTLWAWGANLRGQLGDGTVSARYIPTQVGTRTDWVGVSAGNHHSLALTEAGNVWAWGHNFYGQLGDNTNDERHSPVEIFSGVTPYVTTTTTSTTTTTETSTTTTQSTTTTSSSTTTTQAFDDVPPSNPYYEAITGLGARGIVTGYGDGTFHPNDPVLRKHFAKMIVGAMDLQVTEDDWQDATRPFTDCGKDSLDSLYPHEYIAVAKENGLTQGKTATTFGPDDKITRAQMVTMVVRAAKNSGVPLDAVGADYAGTFKKYNDKTHGANVKLAEANGLLEGLQISGSPAAWIMATATRGEVAQILWNLIALSEGG